VPRAAASLAAVRGARTVTGTDACGDRKNGVEKPKLPTYRLAGTLKGSAEHGGAGDGRHAPWARGHKIGHSPTWRHGVTAMAATT